MPDNIKEIEVRLETLEKSVSDLKKEISYLRTEIKQTNDPQGFAEAMSDKLAKYASEA